MLIQLNFFCVTNFSPKKIQGLLRQVVSILTRIVLHWFESNLRIFLSQKKVFFEQLGVFKRASLTRLNKTKLASA